MLSFGKLSCMVNRVFLNNMGLNLDEARTTLRWFEHGNFLGGKKFCMGKKSLRKTIRQLLLHCQSSIGTIVYSILVIEASTGRDTFA